MSFRLLLLVSALVGACGTSSEMNRGAAAPSCEQVTAFADALTNVGITYDFNPSESAPMLASRVDAVFAGHLTGEFAAHDAEDREPGMSSIAYEVEVDKVVQGEVAVGDRVEVAMEFNPATRPAKEFKDSAVPGVNVVVFAAEVPGRSATELSVGPEGFATACAN